MGQLPRVGNFRDLLAYQKSRSLAREVFEITKGFPREEMYSLTDQIRRSSRSVGAQMAEAWAKRRYAFCKRSAISNSASQPIVYP